MAMEIEETLENVQHFCHLGEDEDPVTASLQLFQQHVQCLQFSFEAK